MKDQDVSFLVVEQALTGTNRPRCVTNSSIVEQALTCLLFDVIRGLGVSVSNLAPATTGDGLLLEMSLLDEPNPNSPANSLAAQLYQDNKREYEKRVATVVELSWLNFQETRIEDPPENNTTH
uniref:UBC core domain-containing protein n=1 Tax=Timema douglasi TaxID=61478 RepID=A0A7R8VMK4_TIMDO|nr:unnamed protein product [Timema douglasi]